MLLAISFACVMLVSPQSVWGIPEAYWASLRGGTSLASALPGATVATQNPAEVPDDASGMVMQLPGLDGTEPMIYLYIGLDRMPQPKICPKHKWLYEYSVGGLGRMAATDNFTARVRVFSQERRRQEDRATMVARMAMRLWDINIRRLRLNHSPAYNEGIIDFYLAFGGQPGGEQLFTEDTQGGNRTRVNVIYIYALHSFTDPVEMAREVAHEYGHATLPPIGGFVTPEDWGNGYLGERLYLRWLRDYLRGGILRPDDVMGATAEGLDAWVRREVDPLVRRVALQGVDWNLLTRTGKAAMDHYTGVALWAESVLPMNAFSRSLRLTGSQRAADYARAVVAAAEEQESWVVRIPPEFAGRDVWIPVGRGRVSNARVLENQHGWAKIRPMAGAIRVTNPPASN